MWTERWFRSKKSKLLAARLQLYRGAAPCSGKDSHMATSQNPPLTKFITGRHPNRSKRTILSQHAESVKRCATTGVRPQLESNFSNVHSHRAPSWKITCSSGVYRVSSSQYNTCSALHRRSQGSAMEARIIFTHKHLNNTCNMGQNPEAFVAMRRSEDRSQAVNG